MMTERKRLLCLLLIMSGVALAVCGITVSLLYHAAIEQTRERLMETAQSQARLIEAVTRFDAVYSSGYSGGAEAATLSQITDAHENYNGFGETGEFTLARREGNAIVFLLSHRHHDLSNPRPVAFDSELAEPMRRALSGQSGTVVGLDYRGTAVIAAYEPVKELNLGIVAKIDMAEVRAPFLWAALMGLGAALLVILLGSTLFVRVTSPMIRRLQELYVTAQQELTARKRAEEDLRIRDQAIRSTSSGVAITDARQPDRPIIFVNEAFERVTGYSAEEVIGRNLRLLQRDDYDQPDIAKIRAAVDEGREVHAVLRNYRKDGTQFWNELTISPVYDNQGDLTHFVGIQNDITERKQAEQALRESEERMRAVLNTADDAIITIDRRGIITGFNRSTERMFGYGKEELVDQNVKILMPPPYRDEHDDYIARYLKTGEARLIGMGREALGRRKDGSTFPIDLAVSEIDHLSLFTGIVRDITERRTLENEILTATTEEQQRVGQDLHDGVGQELTGLSFLAQTLEDTLKQDAPADAQLAGKIVAGLRRIHEQIRAISRGLVPVDVDSKGLAAALSDLAAETANNTDVKCTFTCSDAVEIRDNQVATHLFRMAQEGIANALRHGRARHIEVGLTQVKHTLALYVLDDGVGIRENDTKGDGMGLRIMQHRAHLMDATLSIEPGGKGGTIIRCTLPRSAQS